MAHPPLCGWTVLCDNGDMAPQSRKQPTYPPGHQPYDRLNALRVGAVAGGAGGAVVAAALRGVWAFAIVIGAAVGGVIGWWWDTCDADRGRPPRA
jgi:hypothetical protein